MSHSNQLTSLDRVMTVIAGGIPDRVPTELRRLLMAGALIETAREFGQYRPDGTLRS